MINLLLLAACGKADPAADEGTHEMAAYAGLVDDASWVYRDDGLEEIPDENDLLRSRYQGEGLVELRRGYRWADAAAAGTLQWDTTDGLTLTALHLGPVDWTGEQRLADPQPAQGDQQVRGGSRCITDDTTIVETWYADYDDALVFDCTGDGLPGTWSFARGVGLVRLEVEGLTVDLVAPW